MKRFIFSILCVSVFFVGVGALVDKAGATFKSDEKALELVRKARVAIGGDGAIAGIQSMRIVGRTTQTIKINGVDRTEQGETEIALQLPDKLMKSIKIGHGDETGPLAKIQNKLVDVVVVGSTKDGNKAIGRGEGAGTGIGVEPGGKKTIIKNADGTAEALVEVDKVIVRKDDDGKAVWTNDGKTVNSGGQRAIVRSAGAHREMEHNEMLRLTLGLLLTAPQGMDVNYMYGGEADVDGTACNIVVADFSGQSFKLYLSKSSDLPVMMDYTGAAKSMIVSYNRENAASAEVKKNTMILRKTEDPTTEWADFNVKFSDYRSVGGVQLPYRWTQTVGGAADETFDVTSYEINPANISEKLQHEKVMLKTKKEH